MYREYSQLFFWPGLEAHSLFDISNVAQAGPYPELDACSTVMAALA